MKPSQLNDRQKRMILQYELPDSVLGERFGMSKSSVRQVRVQLKAVCQHLWVGWTDIEACELCNTTRPIVEPPNEPDIQTALPPAGS